MSKLSNRRAYLAHQDRIRSEGSIDGKRKYTSRTQHHMCDLPRNRNRPTVVAPQTLSQPKADYGGTLAVEASISGREVRMQTAALLVRRIISTVVGELYRRTDLVTAMQLVSEANSTRLACLLHMEDGGAWSLSKTSRTPVTPFCVADSTALHIVKSCRPS